MRNTKNKAKTQQEWIYGHHAVMAAAKYRKRQVLEVLYAGKLTSDFQENLQQVPQVQVDIKLLNQKFPQAVHQGIAARVEPVALHALEDVQNQHLLLVLDQVTDPQNLGAILRSADAFGCGGVLLPKGHHAPLNAIVAKAACGALETMPLVEVNLAQGLDKLKDYGFWCVGLAGEATRELNANNRPEKVCVVMGSEGEGLRPLVAKNCDELVKINMQGSVESLNVSVAAGIALHTLQKNRVI